MDSIWVFMIIFSLIIGIATGKTPDILNTIINSAKTATENSISIIGMICFWSGIMKIAEENKIIDRFSKLLKPIIKILFPKLINEKAKGFIALNMTANVLGLGNVATPLGLKAMKSMQEENNNKEELTDEMKMLIVLNTTSIQLIPTTIIGIRAIHDSKNPVIIVIPILIASLTSVIFGVILTKIISNKKGR